MKQLTILVFILIAIGSYIFFMDSHPLKKFRYDFRVDNDIYTLRSINKRRFGKWKSHGNLNGFLPSLRTLDSDEVSKSWSDHKTYGTAAVVNSTGAPKIIFSFASTDQSQGQNLFEGKPSKTATINGEPNKRLLYIRWFMEPDNIEDFKDVKKLSQEREITPIYSKEKQEFLVKSFKLLFETYLPKSFSVQAYDEVWVSFSAGSYTQEEKKSRRQLLQQIKELAQSDPREITYGEGKKAVKVTLTYFYNPKKDDWDTNRQAWVRYQKGN